MSTSGNLRRTLIPFAVIAALAGHVGPGMAASVWIGGAGDWNQAGNWIPSGVPTANDDVSIDDGNPIQSIARMVATPYFNEQFVKDLFIDAGDTLEIQNGRDLFIHGTRVVNNGLLDLASTAGTTGLILMSNSTSFSGSGVLRMSANDDNFVTGRSLYQFPNSPSVLVNEAGHTIRGAGWLGRNEKVNAIGLDNRGLIIADQAAVPLVIDLHDDGIRVNTGTMQATGGGTLSFYISTLNNANVIQAEDGLIEAQDGSTVLLDGSTIDGGILRTSGSGRIYMRNVTVRNARLKDLTLDGQARLVNGESANLVGNITNLGDIRLDSSGGNTWLWVDGDVNLLGNGTLTLSNDSHNLISGIAATDVLTNTASHTIQGSGVLGANAKRFVLSNKGTVVASNAATPLTLILSSPSFNTGTLKADNGAELILQGTELDNTAGTLLAMDASTVTLIGSDIENGTIDTRGTGVLNMRNDSRLHNVTIRSRVVMLNGYRNFLEGTIDNGGSLLLDASTHATSMMISGNVTLAGGGTLSTSDDAGNRILGVSSDDVLTNAAGHTIRGSGLLGNNTMGLVNHGLIEANQTVKLTIDPSAAGGGAVNYGTLRGSGGGGLELHRGDFDNQGVVEALNGSNVTYTTTAVTKNNIDGTLTGGTWLAADFGADATITLRGDAIHTNKANVILKGPDSIIQVGTTLLDGSLHTNAGDLYVANGRVFQATANGGDFINTGVLHLSNQAEFHASTINNTGGILKGADGVVAAHVFGSGFILPGSSTGQLSIDGNLQMAAGGALEIEISSLSDFDLLTVSGDVTLGGDLIILNLGYTPVLGERFIVMTYANRLELSKFDAVSWQGFNNGVEFGVAYNVNDVTLEVTAVPEPGTWAMLLAGLGVVGGLAAPRPSPRRS